MSSRIASPSSTLRHASPIELTEAPGRLSSLEQGQPVDTLPSPSVQARATQAFAGLNKNFHRDYLLPSWQSLNNYRRDICSKGYRLGNATTQHVKRGVVQSWDDSVANLPSARSTLAALGQTVQQVASCGLPTYAREVAFMHAYSALASGLAEKSPYGALTFQAAVSLVSIASHVYVRQPRLERLGAASTVAVRGHFGLSPAHWEELDPAQRQVLGKRQQQDSRNVTRNQVVAEVIYLSLGALGAARGDGALSARVLATQLRNAIYAGSRELMQASVSMTAKQDSTVSVHGVNDNNMVTLGWAYAAMTLTMGFVQDSISQNVLPTGQSLSGAALTDANQQPLNGLQLAKSIQALAGLRAGFNTLIAIMDGHLTRHFDTQQAGTAQILKASLPLTDYDRVLDQSVARTGWTSLASAASMAMEQASSKASPALASFLGNAATAAALGLGYRITNQTFQAHASVRRFSE